MNKNDYAAEDGDAELLRLVGQNHSPLLHLLAML